ncbi:MAG: InlB B-repeat-containing protein [Treponema sp.]|nr:InlB B-repeat-containing protein [Treponema sp.]
MKRLYKIYKYITVFALSFGLFSCSNSITETIAQNSESKAQLCVSMDKSSARTILPESDVSADEITKVELLAKAGSTDSAASVKEWISDDSETAITKMTGDTEILIDAGTYDFTLNLYVSDVLCQVATLQDVTVHAGLNSLSFAAKYADGSFSLSLTDLAAQGVTAVKAGLFTVESYGETAVTDFSLESLTVTEDSVTYAKNNVPSGTYFIRFELYQDGTKIDTLEDILKIAATRTTTKTLALASINTLYSVTYNLNGGEWAADFTPVTSRNANKALELPAVTNATKNGFRCIGWYTDEECTAGNKVTGIAAGTAENKTIYAKWAQIYSIIISDGITNGTVTVSPAEAICGETITLTVTPDQNYGFESFSINDGTITTTQDSENINKFTFVMPEEEVSVHATFSKVTITFDVNGGSGTMDPQQIPLGISTALNTCTLTRENYEFLGWSTAPTESTDAKTPKANYTNGQEITLTEDTTLYAVWDIRFRAAPADRKTGDIVVKNEDTIKYVPYQKWNATRYENWSGFTWTPLGVVLEEGSNHILVTATGGDRLPTVGELQLIYKYTCKYDNTPIVNNSLDKINPNTKWYKNPYKSSQKTGYYSGLGYLDYYVQFENYGNSVHYQDVPRDAKTRYISDLPPIE